MLFGYYNNSLFLVDILCYIFSSIDVDWIGDIIYVAEEKGTVYTIKLKHMVDRSKPPDVDIALVYNGSTIPRAITVHPQKGYNFSFTLFVRQAKLTH